MGEIGLVVTYFNCYFTPNEPIEDFHDKLNDLENAIQTMTGSVVVGGDFAWKALERSVPNLDSCCK